MPYDAEQARLRGEWAVKEWKKLPLLTRAQLLPCLRAADSGFKVVQQRWLEFARVYPMRIWEAAAFSDMVRNLVLNVDGAVRAQLIDEVPVK